MAFVKKSLVWIVLAGIVYALLSYHFIFFHWDDVEILKKSELSLKYTFYSAANKRNERIMAIDELRRDGIGDILVERGDMSEQQHNRLLRQYGD